jgi:hypothetical protein
MLHTLYARCNHEIQLRLQGTEMYASLALSLTYTDQCNAVTLSYYALLQKAVLSRTTAAATKPLDTDHGAQTAQTKHT